MTIHAVRGREGEQNLNFCMIAMRTLSTMYFAAGWIRNVFQQLNDKRATSTLPTRAASPTGLPEVTQEGSVQGHNPDHMAPPALQSWLEEPYGRVDAPTDFTWPSASANGGSNTFTLMSRNLGSFLDCSFINDFGLEGLEGSLEDSWQDCINSQNASGDNHWM
jgi:hypothetical protein